jgi:hypothetical protein
MAPITATMTERRTERRYATAATQWQPEAILRPGIPVVVLNISAHGVLFESAIRLRPGVRTEIQMMTDDRRTSVRGHLVRCQVFGLGPLRYRGVLMFDELIDIGLSDSGQG